MHAEAAPDIRNAPIAFWRIAASLLHALHALFGAPEDLAARHTISRKDHELLSSWLRVAEALIRRLLLIEAAALAARPEQGRAKARQTKRQRRLVAFYPDKPQDWRVSFRCCVGAPDSRRRRAGREAATPARTPPPQTSRFSSAWPLAERYEAILRAYNDPQPYARRLARTLRPQRVGAMLRAPPEFEHRVERAAEINEAARRAWPPTDTS